jgi:DNA repair protein RecN (Recombination protein N)
MRKKHGLYLENLRLQNFATFQNEEVFFNKKFNAIIGETGSGKSLLLDALQMVFGQRADKKLVRKNSDFALIEASFIVDDQSVLGYVEEIGHPSQNNEIVLKRIVYASGTSKSFLNFQQCSLQTLSNFSKRFIDLVGQFENQKLLNENYQLKLLDDFGKLESISDDYTKSFSQLRELQSTLDQKKEDYTNLKQRQDYLNYQIEELEQLDPSVEDEESLIKKKDDLLSGHQHKETLGNALQLLSESEEANVLSMLKQIEKMLSRSQNNKLGNISARITESSIQLQDVSYQLSKLYDVDLDENDLEHIVERLDKYQRLKRKFHVETKELVELYKEFSEELSSLSMLDQDISKLEIEIDQLYSKCENTALKLHEKRLVSSQKLSKSLTRFARELKMNGATLEYQVVKSKELHKYGISEVNFMAEMNPGEGLFKVKDTASGGELSRILLAMRQILSSNDTISVFLFDEIDTGVGGETALAIGKALEEVSTDSQVIAITHLPQIANFSEQVVVVSKETFEEKSGPRTVSIAQALEGNQKMSYIQGMTQLH